MGKSITLFVFEGEKQERQYLHVFLDRLSVNIDRIEIAWCTHIYNLHKNLKDDLGLDTFELLKEECSALSLEGYGRDDIARIYLFFDYDGHVPMADNEVIKEMLEIFDNETDKGKLLLSYPMLEALADNNSDLNFKDITTRIELGGDYKKLPLLSLKKLKELSLSDFGCIVGKHLKKANFLVNGQYENPDSLIEQHDIFNAQLTKHINPNKEVAVLSALPLFYLDYKGALLN
ncbi:hypothetical protein [Bathymodiolus thermophilus thioautotrophic gill symbiont]|uniref:Uncharacterized protein n=1 Tax=Bathymodiolus thermophilus thioautotrophic gill symbiont TaxID=2360 RepID=A0A1J5TUG3_9GAMM|nr:hypothetical protein [Bathymodiolus thermophilus thioautotrophic gill symbiont]OIR24456.1 hypothetical protein BGC33_03685 [Bathymodiolus thermophilus thioautotrophic gill symbiont]